MDQSLARRDALRIFRLVLIVQLVLLGLIFLAVPKPGDLARYALLLRAAPTLLLSLLFLPNWLEPVLGRYYLGLGLGLDVLFSSLETSYLFMDQPLSATAALWLANAGVPPEIIEQLAAAPPIEPFFFLLIPLVLLAWGYGRRGALVGSTWAAILHLAVGIWVVAAGSYPSLFFAQALARIILLYLVPFIVGALAERERLQHAQLETAYQRLRRHATTVEQLAVSRERNRLARDLHDTLSHSLSALMVQSEALRTLLVHDPQAAREMVDALAAFARRGLEEARQAIQALRSDRVQTLGLEGALRDMIQAFQARTGIQTGLTVAGEEPELTEEESQALVRIAEEALTNIELHAAAQQVHVRLACGSDRIDLVIRDDGQGFDLTAVSHDRYGLTGMRERAEMVGAMLEINSHPSGGTEVWCLLKK